MRTYAMRFMRFITAAIGVEADKANRYACRGRCADVDGGR
jgi:hypothetical protein